MRDQFLTSSIRPRNHQKIFLSASETLKTSPDSSVCRCSQQFTYWSEWYLVIPWESPGKVSSLTGQYLVQGQNTKV